MALALREKIAAGMDFWVANRLWADNGRNLSVQPRLRLRTLKTLKIQNSRSGVISSKRHKNTPEVSNFYSFYWMKVKLSVFRLHNRRYFIYHTKSYNAFKFSTAVCNDANLGCLCIHELMRTPVTKEIMRGNSKLGKYRSQSHDPFGQRRGWRALGKSIFFGWKLGFRF